MSLFCLVTLPVLDVHCVYKEILIITKPPVIFFAPFSSFSFSAVPVSVSAADVLQNATIVATSGSLTSSPNRHSDEEKFSTGSPLNGHSSPQSANKHGEKNNSHQQQQQHQLIVSSAESLVSNGDGQTILVTSSLDGSTTTTNGQAVHGNDVRIKSIKSEPQATVLHANEVHIKSEPLDPLPPLASPAQMIDVLPAGVVDRSRELEQSPPATVISLAPAQPYPPNSASQLTFAPTTYDLSGGQYSVQVCHFLFLAPNIYRGRKLDPLFLSSSR